MTGPHDSVIGSDEHNAIKRFVTGMPMRLEPATGDVRIEGALVECGPDGRATSCTAVRVEVPATAS
jgi:calcineurin-like phosphoesterase